MVLGFKRQFEPFVVDGSKRHSIRGGDRWRAGLICDCFVDPRQKTMRAIGRWLCVKVESIQIEGGWEAHSREFFGSVTIGGNTLIHDECEQLARRDGFASFAEMMEFWRGRLPFEGQIIHWDYDHPLPAKVKREKAAAC